MWLIGAIASGLIGAAVMVALFSCLAPVVERTAYVAGLAVAIPALFGYNWLNTRIKSVTADNRVFVDEFVTLLAEQYS